MWSGNVSGMVIMVVIPSFSSFTVNIRYIVGGGGSVAVKLVRRWMYYWMSPLAYWWGGGCSLKGHDPPFGVAVHLISSLI